MAKKRRRIRPHSTGPSYVVCTSSLTAADVLHTRPSDPDPPHVKMLTPGDVWYPREAKGKIHSFGGAVSWAHDIVAGAGGGGARIKKQKRKKNFLRQPDPVETETLAQICFGHPPVRRRVARALGRDKMFAWARLSTYIDCDI